MGDGNKGEKISEVFGSLGIDLDDPKKILKAFEEGEEVFNTPLNEIGMKGGPVLIAGKNYGWPIAKAIISYFQNKKHLNYLDNYDLRNVELID